jgi:hypothetical protein
MKEPENISYLFAHHANGRFTESYNPPPGLKNSHNILARWQQTGENNFIGRLA